MAIAILVRSKSLEITHTKVWSIVHDGRHFIFDELRNEKQILNEQAWKQI